MPEPTCPACGETESLQGRETDGDIAITCEQCGAEWLRGEPRCKACGRPGGTTVPQRMTRHPRGTLLAVVGVRHVPLCGNCDAEVIADAVAHRKPVPEGYVSRFLFGEVVEPAAPARRTPTTSRPTTPRRPSAVSEGTAPPRATPPRPAIPELVDPTVRQATEAFLNDAGDPGDGLTMVLLGTKLGASTRLSRLDVEATTAELARWVQQTYGDRPDQRSQAVATLRRAFSHWRSHGWLTRDPTGGVN